MNSEIYQIIKGRILWLEYLPGTILNEKVLAEEFEVSRTPLREVLSRLEWDQLVRILPRTGTMVAEIEFQQIMNTFQVRLEIEEMVGRLAADNMSDDYLRQLSSLLDQCGELFKGGDKAALMEIDTQLRTILNNCANNPVLKNISESLYDITVRLWCTILGQGSWGEEVQLLYDEIDQTISVLRKPEKQLGALRRETLNGQIQRISQKFLGAGS